jgi:hypothetical protein
MRQINLAFQLAKQRLTTAATRLVAGDVSAAHEAEEALHETENIRAQMRGNPDGTPTGEAPVCAER